MKNLSLCTLALCLALVYAYPGGPPTNTHPDICVSMEPHHDSSRQTGTSPYEIVMAANCYKENMDIPVYVRVNQGQTKYTYYEGLFVQARTGKSKDANVGTFSKSDSQLQTLTCFQDARTAIGQNTKAHWGCKQFMWRAPANYSDEVYFQGTITKNKEIYWTAQNSASISYSATCTVDSKAMDDECAAHHNGARGVHVTSAVLGLAFVGLLQFVLP